MLGASVLPTEKIAHIGAGELAALRDFNPAYVGSGSRTDKTHCEHNESGYPSIADIRADIDWRR